MSINYFKERNELIMQHSETYNNFINQVNAHGYQKSQGYDPNLFNKIYDFERDEVEEILIKLYNKRDWRGIEFMPQLKKVDGIAILKNELPKLPSQSFVKAEFADILLKATGDSIYEDILYESLKISNGVNRNAVLMRLLKYKPTQRLFTTCKDLCANDSSQTVRFFSAAGLLYCAGIINDPINIGNQNPYRYLMDGLASNDISEKNKAFEEFDKLNKSNFY